MGVLCQKSDVESRSFDMPRPIVTVLDQQAGLKAQLKKEKDGRTSPMGFSASSSLLSEQLKKDNQ